LEGWKLTLVDPVDPPPAELAALLRAVHRGSAFLEIADRPGLRWFSFALANSDSLSWRHGETIVLEMKNGDRALALEQYGATEEGEILWLGRESIRLPSDALKRMRFERGIASVLFAGFRAGLEPDSVNAIEVTGGKP
jgi:hypothetical protein